MASHYDEEFIKKVQSFKELTPDNVEFLRDIYSEILPKNFKFSHSRKIICLCDDCELQFKDSVYYNFQNGDSYTIVKSKTYCACRNRIPAIFERTLAEILKMKDDDIKKYREEYYYNLNNTSKDINFNSPHVTNLSFTVNKPKEKSAREIYVEKYAKTIVSACTGASIDNICVELSNDTLKKLLPITLEAIQNIPDENVRYKRALDFIDCIVPYAFEHYQDGIK